MLPRGYHPMLTQPNQLGILTPHTTVYHSTSIPLRNIAKQDHLLSLVGKSSETLNDNVSFDPNQHNA